MNRADRLRRVAPGATEGQIAALAELPFNTVVAIAMFGKQAGRDHLAAVAEKKRQRKADDQRNANYDEDSLTRRNLAVIASQGERARSGNLDALTGLGQVRDYVDTRIRVAVEGCRAEGYSDAVIAETLGITRQAVGQRYGRKGSFTRDDQAG